MIFLNSCKLHFRFLHVAQQNDNERVCGLHHHVGGSKKLLICLSIHVMIWHQVKHKMARISLEMC